MLGQLDADWHSVLEPKTFADAERRGMILGVAEGRHGTTYLITRHTFKRPLMGGVEMSYVIYGLHEIVSLGDQKVRPDDQLTYAGGIDLGIDEKYREARVYNVELEERYRGQGLGLLIYKAAINDLVERGYEVHSGYARSEDAEHVWQSIRRDNPDEVKVISRPAEEEESEMVGTIQIRPAYYVVGGFVGRRPDVRVRGHRRRA
jgi:GNAT superfamily N-acetyltransferase